MVQLQFNVPDWVLRVDKFQAAQQKGTLQKPEYAPIPNFNLGINIKAGAIAVGVACNYARPTWYFGGKIYQVVGFPNNSIIAPIGGALANEKELPINKVTIWVLPRITNQNYSLLYSPPRWFRDVRIKVWQYVGEEYDLFDNLLLDIEQKLNYLIAGQR